jgi:ABC-2 type transport system permease protein
VSRDRAPTTTRTLIRLKLRLMANRARHSTSSRLQMLAAVLVALVAGGGFALLFAAVGLAGDERAARTALVLGAILLTLVWIVAPLMTFGSDETLDPARLVLLPLRPAALARGLLAASFVGPAPAVAVLAAAGAVIGYAGRGGWIVVPAAVLLLVLSATAARTLSTVLAAGLTSRRGRDATIIVGATLGLALQFVRFVRFDAVDAGVFDRIDDVARWLPAGMLGQAVIDARAGHLVTALAELVPAALLIPLLLRWWARALDRSMTVVSEGATVPTRHRSTASLPLLFERLPFLAAAPWGAVAAKELRYIAREPRRKVIAANSFVMGLALMLWPALAGGRDGRTVLLATTASYIAVLNSSNQFGFDGAARWIDVVAGDTARATLIGKNVAVALLILPIVTAIGVAGAAVTGGWGYLPATVLLAVAGLGAGLGTANVVSVRFPLRLPESQSPFAGRGSGQGCGRSTILFACVLVQNLLLVPIAVGAAVAALVNPGWLVIVAPLAVAYGAVLWWIGLTMATGWASSHQPELLAAVDPARGG